MASDDAELTIGLLVLQLPENDAHQARHEYSAWVVLPDGSRSPCIVVDVGLNHPITRLVADAKGRARIVARNGEGTE
jgi:hypothetical protein